MKYPFWLTLLLLACLCINQNYACTLFIAHTGKQVWVGNNEDEDPALTYRLWYYPSVNKSYGYMLWTELTANVQLNKISYKNPQGGMNQWGLFLDYTAIEELPALLDPHKQNREQEVVTDLLKQCKTVSEALKYLSAFNLVRLTAAQLFIADATGDYATVHGAYVVGRNSTNFALSNYSIKNNHHEACWRRDVANQYLNNHTADRLKDMVAILQKTAQKKPSNLVTNYAMASNLRTKTIYLYYKNDFSTSSVINLANELKKGKHYRDMVSYFPSSLKPVLLQKYANGGINAVIATYGQLKNKVPQKYNFKNREVVDMAIQLMANGQVKEAISLLECLKRNGIQALAVDTWLGVAYRLNGRLQDSKASFAKVFKTDPSNYVATLFGKQEDQKITFNMDDFEGAEQVSIIGDFSKWEPISLKKEKGRWRCELKLAPGVYNYKFIVNKEYLADQLNLLFTGSGAKIFSKLYVW